MNCKVSLLPPSRRCGLLTYENGTMQIVLAQHRRKRKLFPLGSFLTFGVIDVMSRSHGQLLACSASRRQAHTATILIFFVYSGRTVWNNSRSQKQCDERDMYVRFIYACGGRLVPDLDSSRVTECTRSAIASSSLYSLDAPTGNVGIPLFPMSFGCSQRHLNARWPPVCCHCLSRKTFEKTVKFGSSYAKGHVCDIFVCLHTQ